MSRFEDLGVAMEKYNKNYDNYKFECMKFTNTLREKFVEYLECPNDNVKFGIVKERPFENSSLKKAMSLEADSFYHIGLSVAIHKEHDPYNRTTLWYELLVKKTKEQYIVGLRAGKLFKMSNNNHEKLKEFFDYFYDNITGHFENFEDFIENNGDKKETSLLEYYIKSRDE